MIEWIAGVLVGTFAGYLAMTIVISERKINKLAVKLDLIRDDIERLKLLETPYLAKRVDTLYEISDILIKRGK